MTSGETPTSSGNTIGPIDFVVSGNVGISKWFKLEETALMDSNDQPFPVKSDGFISCFGFTTGTFAPPTSYDLEIYVNAILVDTENIVAQRENIFVNIPVLAGDEISLQAVRVVSPNASDMYLGMYLTEE